MSPALRAEQFRSLHRDGCFTLPNAWDAGSARLLESLGFPAIATTSAGLAFMLGRRDGATAVSRAEALALARAAYGEMLRVAGLLRGGNLPATMSGIVAHDTIQLLMQPKP